MSKEYNKDFVNSKGLDDQQVKRNRAEYGENVLTPPKKASLWLLYIEKYKDPIIKILIVAAFISLILALFEKDFIETIGIFLAIFLATTIGFYFERDAARKFDVLTALGEEQPVKVKRNGKVLLIPRKDVVVGDVILIEVGDEIPADGELIESTDLQIDESSLTGEPIITKHADQEQNDVETTYPSTKVLRSSMVMNGSGIAIVTAVGDKTEIGKVAYNSMEETEVKTPLDMQLDRLAKMINKIGFSVSVAAFLIFLIHDVITNEVWHGTEYFKMAEIVLNYFMMSVTLIVMAVPEGLPMAVTLSLALNMRRMLKSNNLVRKLHACETMGAVTVICTDKTGTLTQNRMQVADMLIAEGDDGMFADSLALNTTAYLDDETNGIGNPTEVALLLWLKNKGFDYKNIRDNAKIENRISFSTERKYMVTIANIEGSRWLFVKGAPEIVIGHCTIDPDTRESVREALVGYQRKAMRTLAFACKKLVDNTEINSIVGNLRYQGIAAISDPLRVDVPVAVDECCSAGIQVKIVTGDTSATATEIARQIGIWDKDTPDSAQITGADFAAMNDEDAYRKVTELRLMSRARPTDKQRLVQLLQKKGEVVAVTGDGTNDAPALNYAHVGLSLGSGTSVAKNASDITLMDDSFHSIVKAVMWGRSLYKNIQRFLFFQLVVNITALLLVLGGSIIGTELPLTVTQILWVNLIMDTFAAMALSSLPPSHEVMKEKPRKQGDFILSPGMLRGILFIGCSFFVIMFAMLIYFERYAGVSIYELTIFFTVFVMLQCWNLLNVKCIGSNHSAFHHFFRDRGLLAVLAMIVVGQWFIVQFGGKMFRTTPLHAEEWFWIILGTSPVIIIGEFWRFIKRMICRKR